VLPLVSLITQEVIKLKLLGEMDEDELGKMFQKYSPKWSKPEEDGLYDITGLQSILKNCPCLKGDWLSSFFDLAVIRNELTHTASQKAFKTQYSESVQTIHALFSQIQKVLVDSIASNSKSVVSDRCNYIKFLILKFNETNLRKKSKVKYCANKIKRKVFRSNL